MTRTQAQKQIDRQYRAVAHSHVFALANAGLLATNFGWSTGPDYCSSKCMDITGTQFYLTTKRVGRRYTSVVLDWHTRQPVLSAA
jgi:hypothetical protein